MSGPGYRRGDLLGALRHPEALPALSAEEWRMLLPQARSTGVLARIGGALQELQLLDHLPLPVRGHLEAAHALAGENARVLRWEVYRIQRALKDTACPIVLLKGAAYLMRGLPVAKGRMSSDVDIMVPKEKLSMVEAALMRHGWEAIKLGEYDQRYYRSWMHELPPLRHRDRHTVVDVHHTILPESGRLHPDPGHLMASALDLADPQVKTLAAPHMVLHAAVHLFQDGDLEGGLGQVLDLHGLLCHFGSDVRFWNDLVRASQQLDLERPLFYALRYTERLLGTPVPRESFASVAPPPPLTRAIMDLLVTRALVARQPSPSNLATALALWLLYARSHWLRMPPLLLARHLLIKSLHRVHR